MARALAAMAAVGIAVALTSGLLSVKQLVQGVVLLIIIAYVLDRMFGGL